MIGKDFKFKVIKNFLTKEEIPMLQMYCDIQHRTFNQYPSKQIEGMHLTSIYGDPLIDTLSILKKPLMEKETGKKLKESYSYWRMYVHGSELHKHKDRPSCEISVTLNIGSDGTDWPIYMDGTPLVLNPGDAGVYLGCDVLHWRDEFFGDWSAQAFLHYVDANGPNKDYAMDGRHSFGQVYSKINK